MGETFVREYYTSRDGITLYRKGQEKRFFVTRETKKRDCSTGGEKEGLNGLCTVCIHT